MKVLIINTKNQHKNPHVILVTGTKYAVKQPVKLVTIFLAFCVPAELVMGVAFTQNLILQKRLFLLSFLQYLPLSDPDLNNWY